MSYIHQNRHVQQALSSIGDGTGVTDMGVDGKTVSGATAASPSVLTVTAHGYVTGDWIFIDGATGTTEINGLRKVVKINDNSLSLLDEAGTAVDSAGSFGGTTDSNIALVIEPTVITSVNRLRGTLADASVAVDGLGGVSRLSNGVIIAVYRGTTLTTIATLKGLNDFSLYGDVGVIVSDVAGNQMEWSFGWDFSDYASGSNVTDLKLDGTAGEFLAIYTQDDLAALLSLRFSVVGRN